MIIELQIASIISFIVSLFVLYRLLVKKYEAHLQLLTDELTYKQNYKGKLEEFKLFYQEELEILNKRLRNSESETIELSEQIAVVTTRINEITSELSKEATEKEKIKNISKRQQQYLQNNLRALEVYCSELEEENKTVKDQYKDLVTHIKKRHGIDALFEFHYDDNIYEQMKHRRKYNMQQKYISE